MLMPIPMHWRACDLCHHGATVDDVRVCRCPQAVRPAKEQPVAVMRRPFGPCGPEAEHLQFTGLHA